MDGCFGLTRRKRQGQSFDVPKYGTLMFADQDDVDNFVNTHSESAEDVKEASTFILYIIIILFNILCIYSVRQSSFVNCNVHKFSGHFNLLLCFCNMKSIYMKSMKLD